MYKYIHLQYDMKGKLHLMVNQERGQVCQGEPEQPCYK